MKPTKRLPPHTWEAHPIADKGEIKKPFLIAVITIVAVAALVGLLFVGQQFVGKAIFADLSSVQAGQAGIFLGHERPVLKAGDNLIIPIYAHLSTNKSVAVVFILNYPAENLTISDCNSILQRLNQRFIVDSSSLIVISSADCETPGKIVVKFGGLCADERCTNALIRQVHLADVNFTVAHLAESYDFSFDEITPLNLADSKPIILEILGASIKPANDNDDDGIANRRDNCPDKKNAGQNDADNDTIGDVCDNCLDKKNPLQNDADNDTIGDACEEVACTVNANCTAPATCVDNICTTPEEEVPEIQISLRNAEGILVTGNVTKSAVYYIQAVITPTINLSANHLVIVSVSVGGLTKSIYWTNMPVLTAGTPETVRFTYQLSSTATGNLTVKAFVWNDWLGAALYSQLVAPEEVGYEISS